MLWNCSHPPAASSGKASLFPREDLKRILKNVALRAGLNWVRFVTGKCKLCSEIPDLRRIAASRLAADLRDYARAAGVKIHEISRWCGHASIEPTQRYLATTARASVVAMTAGGTVAPDCSQTPD